MESLKALVPLIRNLPNSLPKNSEFSGEVSIYNGGLTAQILVKNIATIKKSFPNLPVGFYDVLTDRLKANGFTDERLTDAVAHVIDTCHYPNPTIAQFISFDRKYKVYSYEEMLRKGDELGHEIWNNFKSVSLPGRTKPVWIHIDDIIKYNL